MLLNLALECRGFEPACAMLLLHTCHLCIPLLEPQSERRHLGPALSQLSRRVRELHRETACICMAFRHINGLSFMRC
jgi:hypothetical protein